jgi:hypothetical protein
VYVVALPVGADRLNSAEETKACRLHGHIMHKERGYVCGCACVCVCALYMH